MTFTDWLAQSYRRFAEEDPWTAVNAAAFELYLGGLRRIDALWQFAPTVYDREWELLVVLDACRVDLLREVAPEYAFLDDPGTVASPASQSRLWLERTFGPQNRDEVARTAYVTGNPYSGDVCDDEDFLVLDEVWRYGWDPDPGTVPPRPITDRAIDVAREHDPDRLVVHYMQPHFPSLADPEIDSAFRIGDPGWVPGHAWDQLEAGDLSRERLWRAYRDNLRCVLDEVALLLANVDADRAVVTADHGNAVGEWGIYGHPPRMPLRCLHVVPWYETTATDDGTHDPAAYERDAAGRDERVAEKLRQLGYLDE